MAEKTGENEKMRETEEFENRLRIWFSIWQVKLMLEKIWLRPDNLEKDQKDQKDLKDPLKIRQEELLAEIAENFDTGVFTPKAWLKMLQGNL